MRVEDVPFNDLFIFFLIRYIMAGGILADTHDHKVPLMNVTETLVPNVLIYGKFKEYVTK